MIAPPNVLALIGDTPMLELTKFDTGHCRLFLKIESNNPSGSIKDRMARSMIAAAKKSGKLRPGMRIIEATAGNTGLALALCARQEGYPLTLIVPDKMSREKILHLRALGAEVQITRSDVGRGHAEYYQDIAERMAMDDERFYWPNQFANPANPQAHEETTAPEIVRQLGRCPDAVICGVGSGGTLTGIGRYLHRLNPDMQMVLADPIGSVLAPTVLGEPIPKGGSWLVEGIGEDFIPPNCDLTQIATAISISDIEMAETVRQLALREGILAGSSTGVLLAGALRWCRQQKEPKCAVTFACDGGDKYLHKEFDLSWCFERDLLPDTKKSGTLDDLIAHRFDRNQIVTVSPADTLKTAYDRMRMFDVSQLPVIDSVGSLAGIIDEENMLPLPDISRDKLADYFERPVEQHMNKNIQSLQVDASLESLHALLYQGRVAIIMDGEQFIGLVTKIDFLSYMRRMS